MSAQTVDQPVAPVDEAGLSIVESTNRTQHDSPPDDDSAHGSAGRQKFSSQLRPLQVKKSRSVNWAKSAQESDVESTYGTPSGTIERNKVPLTPYSQRVPISLESERIITSKIEQLSQLGSPQLRELARRLGNMYKVETPRYSKRGAPNPYADIEVGARWEEIQGCNQWAGLLDPIDPALRAEIVRYGEFTQATYDSFDGDTDSKYCGSSKYTKDVLLEKAGLDNRGYEITDFLYATSDIDMPNFFSRSLADDTWSKDSNWMGYVAVCTSPEEIARLGRRDIVVAWRGTWTKLEWIEDVQDYLAPAGFDPRNGDSDVCVESGFLSVYKSSNEHSRYNKTSAREQVLGAVKKLVEKYRDEGKLSITAVGHSLGSALAMLCAYDIAESRMNLPSGSTPVPKEWDSQRPKEMGSGINAYEEKTGKDLQAVSGSKFPSDRIPITVFSFGGPRVGNRAFKDRVDELGVAVLRVANKNDLVTKVPGVLFQHGMAILQKIVTFLPAYKHVGQKLKVDNLLDTEYLLETRNVANVHNLELYMHLVDGYHGSGRPFKPTLRDYALVNKGGEFLKKEYFIPPSWWQEENKGLVRDKDGHWTVPVRDAQLFPKTPVAPQSNDEMSADALLRSVSVAVQRSQERTGIEAQVLPVPKGQAAPSHRSALEQL